MTAVCIPLHAAFDASDAQVDILCYVILMCLSTQLKTFSCFVEFVAAP
jgi:hypothetical protein